MSDLNLTSKTKLKTNPIYPNSICTIKQKKSTKVFIAQSKGIHIYDTANQTFENMKISQNNGHLTCITQSDDLIFFCFGMKIMASGTNGKILYQSDTYLAVDRVDAIHIHGYQLWLVAGNMVSQFLIGGVQIGNKKSRITPPPSQSIQDINSQMFDIKINHSLLIKIDTQKPFLLLLKNSNQVETFENKKDSGAVYATESPPTYGYLYPNTPNNQNKVLIGTMNGQIIYLQVEKKKIKQLWTIKQNSKGRINCIVEVKNGFLVFRDPHIQMWNHNRQFIGKENISEKVISAVYLSEEESVLYGSVAGQIIEMYNYEKMMKLAKERNEASQKAKILKEIEDLKKIKLQMKTKLQKMNTNLNSSATKSIKNNFTVSIDYVKLCYCVQINSQRPLIKLSIKGEVQLLADSKIIIFQGSQKNLKVYMIRTQQKKAFTFHIKFLQVFHEYQKLSCTIYNDSEGKLIASNYILDLKHLSLHQKIDNKKYNQSNNSSNVLKINGQFKYFQINAWLNSIFNEFGLSPENCENYIECCYESLVTKNKILIRYKNGQCQIYSQSPTPLTIIKRVLIQKSKQKNLSLNYDTKTNIEGIQNLLKKINPRIKQFQTNKRELDILAGLIELQNQSLSSDLKNILDRADEIRQKYKQYQREYQQMKSSIRQFYTNYRVLNQKSVTQYQLEQLNTLISKFNPQKIIKLIVS